HLQGALLTLRSLIAVPLAWYKHVASPRYHTVGRAAGLLMGLRRSPYLWRREMSPSTVGSASSPGSMPIFCPSPHLNFKPGSPKTHSLPSAKGFQRVSRNLHDFLLGRKDPT
uniref:Uncharacterized protein n=1 Tax=Marmota marmota marmota TaxID=9994 RepID=A0A8C6ESR2_MARMA